ncbi:phasin family protein [Aestuariivirga litoralis]|uniref:Phasin family protein n=1 Tax=Aestuariivirga litoralis TaxID=2650924 RepID=A0A2W2C4Y5_9HYPH|nr:phasin family protein [Aestuariivirga litoralis]PZF75223.1 phasin family protein [Aestuariivirga litoralis]
MMKSFEEFQSFGKDGFEAYVAASNALTKGFQAIAQEAADYSRKSFEKGTAAFEKLSASKSLDKALEVQQALAKEHYEALVAQVTKMNEMYIATAKEAYKPFEASMAAFGVKAPK